MESVQLSQFFKNVSNWPKSQGELNQVTDRLAELLGSNFGFLSMCIYETKNAETDSEKYAHKFSESVNVQGINISLFCDYLKKQIHNLDLTFGDRLRQIQIPREQISFGNLATYSNLAVFPIWRDLKPEILYRNGKARKEIGVIVVGSTRPLATREEVMMLAAAQHLCDLGAMSFLESLIQLRSQFLSIASHELKTPLTSIYGLLQLQERTTRIKKDEPNTVREDRQLSYLRMVIRQVERLNELIDGLLDLSRIQNGRFMVEPSSTDVAALVREVTQSRLTVIASEAGVRLNVEAPQSLLAWVDPVRMEELVNNLVMNAIRFSPEGGVIWVKLREDASALRLTVRDQGPSVPIEDHERIFRPFERAQRTSRLGGLGLGLFISRQIAQLHGGNVSLVESIPGKGNVFEAYFPIKSENLISVSA